MPNLAVVIGIDNYQPESNLRPLRAAVRDARSFAQWLLDSGWVTADRLLLLCGTDEPRPGELPATLEAIVQALGKVLIYGRRAGNGDRLYFFFAGHGNEYGYEQILWAQNKVVISPQLAALPWNQLCNWLQGCGFPTQICLLDTCRTALPDADFRFVPQLPIGPPPSPVYPPSLTQLVLLATDHGDPAYERSDQGLFTRTLLESLGGGGGVPVAIDPATWERVVYYKALASHLNKVVRERSGMRQRCIMSPYNPIDNLILARLGSAPLANLKVQVMPDEIATTARVVVGFDEDEAPHYERRERPFIFQLPQGARYTISGEAPGYEHLPMSIRISRPLAQFELRLYPVGSPPTLGRRDNKVKLSIALDEPFLPMWLYDLEGRSISLQGPNRQGSRTAEVVPDIYRLVIHTPYQPYRFEQTIVVSQKQQAMRVEPALPPREATPLERLLGDIGRGARFEVDLRAEQAGLVIVCDQDTVLQPQDDMARAGLVWHARQASLRLDAYMTAKGAIWVRLEQSGPGAAAFFVRVPLQARMVSLVGVTFGAGGAPEVEVLIAAPQVRRPQVMEQRLVLRSQQFARQGAWDDIIEMLQNPPDRLLPLLIAGYARLAGSQAEAAAGIGQRLVEIAPERAEGSIIRAAAGATRTGQASAPELPNNELPLTQGYLLTLVQLYAAEHTDGAALRDLLPHIVPDQFWLVVSGRPQTG